ncbi:MAG: HEAT repeat domain-containing protein [Acidobacteria bacterium]|nr:HEAT repeat domain-containing protein [Acidobacteriota bacterium]
MRSCVEKELVPRLQETEALIRASVAEVLGAIGGAPSLAALQKMQDKDRDVVRAVAQAVERIKMRRG